MNLHRRWVTEMKERPIPELAEIRRREIERFLGVAFRVRFLLIPLLLVLLVLFALFEPRLWKAGFTALLTAGVLLLFVRDLRRLRLHGLREEHLPWILLSVFALQSGLIFITGAIESPFLPAFFPVALATGMALGRLRQMARILLVPVAAIWVMALGVWTGLLPSPTPRFWGLGQGFAHLGLYVFFRSLVYSLVLLGVGAQGALFRSMYERILRRTVAAEHDARETLLQTNREIHSLTGSIAHELKNPLASVQGLAELLERSLPEKGRERRRARVLREEAQRMGAVLEEFLNLSRPLARPALQDLDAREILNDVADLHEGMAAGNDVQLAVLPAPEPLPRVQWDPRKIRQILANLIINAMEAVGAGGRVILQARTGPPGRIELVVGDSGTGPPDGMEQRIFQAGVTTKERGAGLGLTVARALAGQHGGTIRVRRPVTGGCEMVVELPVQPPERSEEPS